MNIVATWMYSTPPGDKVTHTQVGKDSDSHIVQNYYWRCAFCLFESSHRLNKEVRHLLFINKMPPKEIDGINVHKLLERLDIEVISLSNITRPPKDYYSAWNTQFVVLDILDWLNENIRPEDAVFILDGDCVFHKGIDGKIIQDLKKNKALLYTIDYPETYCINGLSRQELKQISQELDPALNINSFIYSGGESICLAGDQVSQVALRARVAFERSIERYQQGQKKFNEEAHLLSFVYHQLGYQSHTANAYIKRIWTDRISVSNVDGSEDGLTIWHLPAEKKRGFVKLFQKLFSNHELHSLDDEDVKTILGINETLSRRVYRQLITFRRNVYHMLVDRHKG